MKKIVLVNQHTAYLFIDIANAFAEEYDEVILFAGVIHPLGSELDSKVKVVKISPYDISSSTKRIWTWIKGFTQTVWLLWTKYRKYEIFTYSNPPLLAFLPFFIKRNRMSHLIVDVYPDALVSANILKSDKHLIFRFWSKLNKHCFRKYNSISTISQGMSKRLLPYFSNQEIQVVPLWPAKSLENNQIDRNKNEFIKLHGLNKDHFFVIYSGNLGKGHNVEFLVELAKFMKDETNICFIMAGNGFKRDMIEKLLKNYELNNFFLFGYQEESIFNHLLAATDLGVVTIDDPMAYISIPSKTFNLMAAKKPILCYGKEDSDLGLLVKESNCGLVLRDNDLQKSKEFILSLSLNKIYYKSLSQNAYLSSLKYTSQNAKKFVELHLFSSKN